MIITPARPDDLQTLVDLRAEARAWLAQRGTDQWAELWPTPGAMLGKFRASIEAGQVWLVYDDGDPMGSLTLDSYCLPELWTPDECAEPARYVSKVSVRRAYAGRGIGSQLLDWAGTQAARAGARWLRLDAWTTNTNLHRYYRDHGFHHVRTVVSDRPSGALFQRPAREVPTPDLTTVPSANGDQEPAEHR